MGCRQRAVGNELRSSWTYRLQPAPRRCHFHWKNTKMGRKQKKQKNPPPKTKKTHHRWKNYLPDIENSFCYMNPDMCYPIKGRRVRWGGKKGNWRKKILSEKILSTAFHLFSRDRVSGEGGGMSALMVTRQGHRLNTKDSFPQKYLQERWRFLTSRWLLVCWLIL